LSDMFNNVSNIIMYYKPIWNLLE